MTEDLRRILNNHECVGVRFFGNELDFGNLGQGDHDEQDFLVLSGIGAGSLQKSSAPADFIKDGVGNCFVLVGDDQDGFFPVQACNYGIRNLEPTKKDSNVYRPADAKRGERRTSSKTH